MNPYPELDPNQIIPYLDKTQHKLEPEPKNVQTNSGKENKQIDFDEKSKSTISQPMLKKKKIIIGIIVAIVILAIIGGVLAAVMTNLPIDENNERNFCQINPEKCQGIREETAQFILSKYTDTNQINSLFQVAKTLQKIGQISGQNSTQAYVSIYRDLFKSAKCSFAIFGDDYLKNFQEIQSLYLKTQKEAQRYLNMTLSFSGEPVRPSQVGEQQLSCNFTITQAVSENSRNLQSEASICDTKEISLRFISGIGYTAAKALSALKQIVACIDTQIQIDVITTFMSPKQHQIQFWYQIIINFQHKLQTEGRPTSKSVLVKYLLVLIGVSEQSLLNSQQSLYEQFTAYIISEICGSDFLYNQLYYNVDYHLPIIQQDIAEGKKVIIISHSVGTFYTNQLYRRLTTAQKSNVGLVYVGETDGSMADGTQNYMTNPNDFVVNYIQTVSQSRPIISPMPANMEAKQFGNFVYLNHDFEKYLEFYRSIFVNLLKTVIENTLQPIPTVRSGPITMHATWSQGSSVTFHVSEPTAYMTEDTISGNNVGALQFNQYQAHYYVDCDKVIPGTYKFYILTYDTTYRIQVKAGNQEEVFTGTIVPPFRPDSPKRQIFSIVVSINNENNKLVYTIP